MTTDHNPLDQEVPPLAWHEDWVMRPGQTEGFLGEHVEAWISDAMDNCIVISFTDGERASIEVSWAEARELIAALAAVL